MEISLFNSFILVLAIGAVAQWVGWRLKIPAILLLLAAGLMVGPVVGILEPDEVFGDLLFPVVSAAVAIILFEGGLSLKLRDLTKGGTAILRLVTVGVGVTWGLAAWLSWWLLEFPPILAILFGALLTVTGPTVIGPMLRAIRPKGSVKAIAKWEGILNDPLGVLLAVLVFEVYLSQSYDHATSFILIGLGETLLIGVVFAGAAAGFLLLLVRAKLMPEFLHNLFVLALVLGIFGASNALLEESGLLTVTLFGVILANQSVFNVRHIIEFKENLQVLLISALFVVLAARVDFAVFEVLGWQSLIFIAALIVLVRPLSILVATIGSKQTQWRDKLLLMLLAPRGMVAMVLTSIFALRLEERGEPLGANMLAVMLLVIVATVLFYGLAAGPISSRLGLSNLDPQGVLFVGAHDWARTIAVKLKSMGVSVRLIDSNRYHVGNAVHDGLTADCGNVFSEEFLENLDMSNVGHALALTANDEVNSFAQTTLAHYIEKGDIYPLKSERSANQGDDDTKTLNPVFGENVTFTWLKRQFALGATLKDMSLSEEQEFSEVKESLGPRALLMFAIEEEGRVRVFSARTKIRPRGGMKLVYLELASEKSPAAEKETSEQLAT